MNVKDTIAWVSKEECITSNHLPICGHVSNHKAPIINSHSPERKLRVSKEEVPQFTRLVMEWLPSFTTLNIEEKTDKSAQDIYLALINSLEAAKKRLNKTSERKVSW